MQRVFLGYEHDNHDHIDYVIQSSHEDFPPCIDMTKFVPGSRSRNDIQNAMIYIVLIAYETMINVNMDENDYLKRYKNNMILKSNIKSKHRYFLSNEFIGALFNKSRLQMNYRNILKVLTDTGCTLSKQTYQDLNIDDTEMVKITGYTRIKTSGTAKNVNKNERKKIMKQMKTLLTFGIPIIGGIKLPYNQNNIKNNGIVGKSDNTVPHPVLFIGYRNNDKQKNTGHFMFHSTNGKGWGDKGYGTISYKSLGDVKFLDLWVITGFHTGIYKNIVNENIISNLEKVISINKND